MKILLLFAFIVLLLFIILLLIVVAKMFDNNSKYTVKKFRHKNYEKIKSKKNYENTKKI